MSTLPFSALAALPAPYQLRPQCNDDDGFAAALYSSTRGDLRQMPAEPAFIEKLIAMQRHMQTQGYRQAYPHAHYLVLQRDASPIGRLVIEQQGRVLHLIDIAILPAAQGQGAGSAVLRGLQAQASAQRLSIHLAVNKSNAAARQLYQRLGFQLRGENEVQEQLAWSAP